MWIVARIALGLGLLVVASLAQAAEPVKLRATLQLPMSSHFGTNFTQFKEEVEKRSQGAITVEIFPDGKLFKEDELIQAVASGKIEMASVPMTQIASIVPASKIFYQPFMFNYEPLVRAATRPGSEFRTVVDGAITKVTGLPVLWWQPYGNTVFFTRGRPVGDVSALQGMKIRAAGDVLHDFVEACGGVASVISALKLNQALSDGTVDAAMTGITGAEQRELWKVTDTVTRTDHAVNEFIVVINDKVWNAFSDSQRSLIQEVAVKVEAALHDSMADVEARAYDFARSKNMTIITPTQNQLAEWRGCSAKVFEDFLQNNADIAPRLMTAYAKLRSDPCCNAQPADTFDRH